LEELLPHAFDNSSNIYPITVFAAPSDEAFVVYPIVILTENAIHAGVRGEIR